MMNNEQNSLSEINHGSAKNLTFLTYILYFIGVVSAGIFSTIGVMLAYIRRKGLENTIFYGHLSYLIKTFWIFIILQIIGFILVKVKGIGILILIVAYIWYIYRLVSGFTKLSDNKPIK